MIIVKIVTSLLVFMVGWKVIKLREPGYASGVPEVRIKIVFTVALFYMFIVAGVQSCVFWQDAVIHSLFWASMVLCAVCDYFTTEIYNFSYLPAVISGSLLLWMNNAWCYVLDLFLFVMVQYVVFSRLYGASDCIAYSVCALYLAADGQSFESYVQLMLYVHLIFTAVQLLTGNITKKIRLKESKPLIPYITVVMLMLCV